MSVKEYKIALENLSEKAKALLFALYDNASDHSASDEELADRMGYAGPSATYTRIGKVGKNIAELLSKTPKNYHRTGPAWFHFVGGKYSNEKSSRKKDERWEMSEHLSKAIEEFRSERRK